MADVALEGPKKWEKYSHTELSFSSRVRIKF